MSIHKLWMKKENRDTYFFSIPKEIRKLLKRRSERNQLLHPMYIEDFEKETGKILNESDKGFGNTIYKTYFSALYEITPKINLSSNQWVLLQEWERDNAFKS